MLMNPSIPRLTNWHDFSVYIYIIIYPALMYAVMFYVILNKRKRLGDCVRNRYTVTRACANIYLGAHGLYLAVLCTQVHNAFLQAINTFMQAVNAFMCAA